MKKFLIGFSVFCVMSIIGYWFFQQKTLNNENQPNLKNSSTEETFEQSKNRASNAFFGSITEQIGSVIELWTGGETYEGFLDDQNNAEAIKNLIRQTEKARNVDIEYSIITSDKDFVVRLHVKNEDSMYCMDSLLVKGLAGSRTKIEKYDPKMLVSKDNCSLVK